jgi:dipeptidase E
MTTRNLDLLLLSNGTGATGRYLSDFEDEVSVYARAASAGLFVPYAQVTREWDQHTEMVESVLGVPLRPIHRESRPAAAIERSELIVVSGGNTFHLLHHLRSLGLLSALRHTALDGTPYLGWSAGANIASPTICTTNDMPIIDPCGFEALDLISFQINPHYTNALPEGHRAETRHQRIAEFTAFNPALAVLGLSEGAWLRVRGDDYVLGGTAGSHWFGHGADPVPLDNGVLPIEFALAGRT